MQFINLQDQQKKIRKNIESRVKKVLDHGQYIMGPEVFELEEKLAIDVNVKHCISCSSGTDALLISLMANNIGPGDAVLTTPFTYIATAEVISLIGATPVFVDINEDTFNIDVKNIEDAIKLSVKKKLKPKAIIPVDIFGLPARYRIIKNIASRFNLIVIEDAAQGYGSKIREDKSCSFGDLATTSFFPSKPLGCYGDGGAIFTNNGNIAKKVRSIRNHGEGDNKYDNVRLGINGRLDSIQAAVLIEKLSIFSNELILRGKVSNRYILNLSKQFKIQYIPKNYKSSWAQFSILIPLGQSRTDLMISLKKYKIPTMIYYPTPLHLQKVFLKLGYTKGSLPVSESVSKRILSLPMYPYLNSHKQDYIIEKLNSLVK